MPRSRIAQQELLHLHVVAIFFETFLIVIRHLLSKAIPSVRYDFFIIYCQKVMLYRLLYHKERICTDLSRGVLQSARPGNGILPGRLR